MNPTLHNVRRVLLGLFASCILVIGVSIPAKIYAASTSVDTKLQLSVNPVDCTVDLVQDGTGQTLQIPAHSCLPIVPSILTPVLDQAPQATPIISLPRTQTDNQLPTIPVIIMQPLSEGGGLWAPVATTAAAGETFHSAAAETMPVVVAGVGAIAGVTAIGVDAALFELSHSKSAAQWARSRLKLPVKLRP